jgi:glycine betaine/choline ABC-type transport system substrate-binding protein
MKRLLLALPLLLAAACDEAADSLGIGSKDFGESQILAEMMAALAEDAGIAVTRRTGLGDTLVNLEALKTGEIDLYPEYNGTGLVMVGQAPSTDGDEAMERVRALYEPLGLTWGARFGFENNYGLAMREGRAEELGVVTISDLEGEAGALAIGIDENFAERPLDGYQALVARYGMEFGTVREVAAEERTSLYDMLLSGEADVVEVFTTDGQIADLGLRLLEDDLEFFPVYQAAPLYRADALARFPGLRDAVGQLEGNLDAATMQRLNAQVEQDALSPREVARAALVELGLVDGDEGLRIEEPVIVAHSPLIGTEEETGLALRAVRRAFPVRRVLLQPMDDPLLGVGTGAAPLALVAAVELADLADDAPQARPFEGVGVVGQTVLHLVALGEATGLGDSATLATGPVGSASHRAAVILAAGSGREVELLAAEGEDPLAAIAASGADAAVIMAPPGSPAVAALLEGGGRLVPVDGWEDGNNLVRFPQLRQARIPADTYEGQPRAIETLSSQLILAGPVVDDTDAIGPQGPAASAPTDVAELTDDTVLALRDGLGASVGLDPAVRAASALAPELPSPAAAVNPSTSISALTAAVFALFVWLIWLYARPERR